MNFLESFNRDWWKLVICLFVLIFGILNQRPVLIFLSLAAIISWLIRKKL